MTITVGRSVSVSVSVSVSESIIAIAIQKAIENAMKNDHDACAAGPISENSVESHRNQPSSPAGAQSDNLECSSTLVQLFSPFSSRRPLLVRRARAIFIRPCKNCRV